MADNRPEIFMPPNLLKAKVGGTVTGLDTAAIKRAESAMATLKEEFSDWLTNDIEHLTATHKAFNNSKNLQNVGYLFRAAHDLKGQATTFEYPLIARAAASLCKLMDALKSHEAIPLPLVDAHVDAIQVIHREKIKDISNRTALTLVEELEGRVTKVLANSVCKNSNV
ncbi:MAG: Hpt domain-containing protein [Alphaproteobacteria bacterium]|nr:Hpt domain-containing protein [Alphaproteobacteria bacterium]